MFYSENYQEKIIGDFLKSLYGKEEMKMDTLSKITECLYKNDRFSKFLFDKIIHKEKQSFFIRFENLENLKHLAMIIKLISSSVSSDESPNFDLNLGIIFISEREFIFRFFSFTFAAYFLHYCIPF